MRDPNGYDWTEIVENPTDFQAHLMGMLTQEIPSVTLYFGGGQGSPLVWVKGPEHAVKWFMYLLHLEVQRTERAWDEEEVPPAEDSFLKRMWASQDRTPL